MTLPTPPQNNVGFDYTGAKVLVTGGTSGIGAAIAASYHQAGAEVTISGTRASAEDYREAVGPYRYVQLDVTRAEQIPGVAEALPDLDILINSAGVALASLGQDEWDPDLFARAVEMHLTSVYRLSHAFLPQLKASRIAGGASTIGIASMSAYFGMEVVPGYGAAKGGLVQMMKTLGVSWAKYGIRANAIAAGLVTSRQTAPITSNAEADGKLLTRTPIKRFGCADDIAAAVLFLTSGAASYVTGQTWNVDGGFSIAG